MRLLIKVECMEGEESMYISEVPDNLIYNLGELIGKIQEYSGYFPTGQYYRPEDPTPESLYSDFSCYSDFLGRLPSPSSGIKKILEVSLLEEVNTLYM